MSDSHSAAFDNAATCEECGHYDRYHRRVTTTVEGRNRVSMATPRLAAQMDPTNPRPLCRRVVYEVRP